MKLAEPVMLSCGLNDSQDKVHLIFCSSLAREVQFGLRGALRQRTKEHELRPNHRDYRLDAPFE